MPDTNKHGLGRYIPEEIRYEVRRKCRFGCVVCGAVPYEYHHFKTPFAEALSHDPDDIILLCDSHHRQAGTILQNDWLDLAKTQRSEAQEARFKLPGTSRDFKVRWPSVQLDATKNSVVVNGESILSVVAQDNALEPVLLSGVFSSRDGVEICRIENNAIISRVSNLGDFKIISNRFTYRNAKGEEDLAFTLDNSGIAVDRIYHVHGGVAIFGNDRCFRIHDGEKLIDVTGTRSVKSEVAIEVKSAGYFDYTGVDLENMRVNARIRGEITEDNRAGISIDTNGSGLRITGMHFGSR
ncbi:HNH endonuclease [Rhizobium leguminosarum]|uniref:HNH endonuclease signature motif containing protein n=1 Tax=Rhizobium leguminosarum TaxID=384 RepID=UPI001C95D59C|nr:HNH endonuclease signature motif containing protein [Rhizobium leguminosarum]MBY5357252.1 HNH endonuclease [Rhizobium leguminosarum]